MSKVDTVLKELLPLRSCKRPPRENALFRARRLLVCRRFTVETPSRSEKKTRGLQFGEQEQTGDSRLRNASSDSRNYVGSLFPMTLGSSQKKGGYPERNSAANILFEALKFEASGRIRHECRVVLLYPMVSVLSKETMHFTHLCVRLVRIRYVRCDTHRTPTWSRGANNHTLLRVARVDA